MSKSYLVCIVCGAKLTKDENFVRDRHILTGIGYVRGRTCTSCYETHKEPTIWEILGK